MKIDPHNALLQTTHSNDVDKSMPSASSIKGEDLLLPSLNRDFYQKLQDANLHNAKDILAFLANYDVKNEGNQTVKENRQRNILMYARQQSALENADNQDDINQALLSYLSYQGFYHQFTLDLLGMTDKQDDYEGFFKPDSAAFSF